ncbi:acetyl-CoA C-acetyltransferase [Dietzia sp.]|uniref:acetyl-CoA C-acetyltransferase n=1 Tax=Dietzia sp. TaxID=1871616 RepID=UPI002FD8D3E1
MPGQEAFIFDSVRTPRGRGKATGSLHTIAPIELAVTVINGLLDRNPDLDRSQIDDIVMGIVSPVGDQGAVLPRVAALAAGLPETIPGVQENRFCASGLEAVNLGAEKVRSGWEDLVLAGGVESMSRVPMASDGGAWAENPNINYRTSFVPQGVGADLIATMEGFSRRQVDEFAQRSQELATQAWEEGRFARSIVPVVDSAGQLMLDRDEHIRSGTTADDLAALKPSFEMLGREAGFDSVALQKYVTVESIEHVHHAGNSSGIVDGAAMMLIGSEEAGKRNGLTPRAKFITAGVVGSEPTIMLTGPTPAAAKVLAKAGLTIDDIDLFEVNEAFAAVPMKFSKDTGAPIDKINVNGGSIAMGHPLGATGAMILGTALDELERTGKKRALATLCVGAGMGIATIIERV